MANVAHWHNRAKPKEDVFFELLAREEWEQAEFEAKTDPFVALKPAVVDNFLVGPSSTASLPCKITPMHQACAHGAPLTLLEFLHKANPQFLLTQDSYYHRLPLHIAFISEKYNDKPAILSELLEYEKLSAMGKDALGRYPLHYACHHHHGNPSVIEALILAYPQAAKCPDVHGWLPIHVACRSKMPESAIEKLLEAYPQAIHNKTDKGKTPLDYAKKTTNDQTIELLEQAATSSPIARENKESDDALLESPTPDAHQRDEKNKVFVKLHDPRTHKDDAFAHAPSHFMNLPARPESPTNDDPSATGGPQKPELSHLAFSPKSPFGHDKKLKIPFLGVQRLDLDE